MHQEDACWRRDPKISFSDFYIEIASKLDGGRDSNTIKVESYPVHRVTLRWPSSARKSKYLVRLLSKRYSNNPSSSMCCRIELHPLAARAFPCMLDYVYKPNDPLDIDTCNATALYFLGEYFEMESLSSDAKDFVRNEISLSNVDTYLDHAMILQNDVFLEEVVLPFLAENILQLDIPTTAGSSATSTDDDVVIVDIESSSATARTLARLDGQQWKKLLDLSNNTSGREQNDRKVAVSHHLSKLVWNYCCKNESFLWDIATFRDLTSEDRLPYIHPSVALELGTVEDWLSAKTNAPVHAISAKLSPLQERCTAAFATEMKNFQTYLSEETVTVLNSAKSAFVVNLLIKYHADMQRLEVEEPPNQVANKNEEHSLELEFKDSRRPAVTRNKAG